MNFPIQGIGADIFKLAMVSIDEKITRQKLNAYIVHTMHDEIFVEAETSCSEKVKQIIKECMENAFHRLIPAVAVQVEADIRKSWEKIEPSEIKTCLQCTYYFPSRFIDYEHAFITI